MTDIDPSRSSGDTSLAFIQSTLQVWAHSGRKQINELDSKNILAHAGLPIPARVGQSLSVVKFCSDAAMHKSELGFVQLKVEPSETQSVRSAMKTRAAQAGIEHGEFLVEEMIADGLMEWFVGCRNDATFGPVVVLGVGGIYAELFSDPEIRLAPLSEPEAAEAIRSHKAFAIMDGARGKPKGDLDRFAQVVSAISWFFWRNSGLIQEMDLNPVIVRPTGVEASVVIADASIVLLSGRNVGG